ncbi:MAG TPA: response regulator [Steroidobacteraceae bacterium]|jgi:CheY-like chemotaxis protein|nr:response regulator [Steroidobacteraceae bacterium]
MGAKRALIVDDSKSARLFLARTLEKYDIDVDSAESAEAAIDYLNSNRPDVIFMDHLMPGMDGLQAVQAIKNDPRTATIPIMMYTSQEGELYLGQARALGAVGVLPKQIKPTDVSKVLYQLHLVADRRSPEQSSFTPLGVTGDVVAPELAAPLLPRALTESGLREHFAELRRALVAGIDTQTERITAEVRALLLEGLPRPPQPPQPQPSWPWIVACVALGAALVSSILWWRSVQLLEGLQVQMTQLHAGQAVPAALPAQEAPSAQPATGAPGTAPGTAQGAAPGAAQGAAPGLAAVAPSPAAGDARPTILSVPYGADALGGARLEVIRQLLYRLARQKVSGVVDIRSFAGRFCLVGNALDGYSPAPDETPFARCDLVGNPSEEALSALQHTPLALANLIGEVRASTHGALAAQVSVGDSASVLIPYPTPSAELSAGDWNHAASANNRVEIRVH